MTVCVNFVLEVHPVIGREVMSIICTAMFFAAYSVATGMFTHRDVDTTGMLTLCGAPAKMAHPLASVSSTFAIDVDAAGMLTRTTGSLHCMSTSV